MDLIKNKTTDRAGFTLVEILLGLSIFSIITLTAYSVFYTGIKVSSCVQGQAQVLREVRGILDLMQNEFENMLFYDYSSSYENKTALSGTSDRIEFVLGSGDGLTVVKYYLVAAGYNKVHQVVKGSARSNNVNVLLENKSEQNSYCLIREERNFIDDLAEKFSESGFEIIFENIKKQNGVRFFYGHLDARSSSEIIWEENWHNNYLAPMIRVEVDLVMNQDNEKVVTLIKDIFIPTGNKGKNED